MIPLRTFPTRTRGFSLVEALLAIAILAAAMLVASQGVMATTNGKLAVQRSREIRQWHADRILQFQHGTRLADEVGALEDTDDEFTQTVTGTTDSGYPVTVVETVKLCSPNPYAVIVSTATWTMPGATDETNDELTGLQARQRSP